jgi:lysophospholipase L1-like esterase
MNKKYALLNSSKVITNIAVWDEVRPWNPINEKAFMGTKTDKTVGQTFHNRIGQSFTHNIVIDGNSITRGYGDGEVSSPNLAVISAGLGQYDYINLASNGSATTNLILSAGNKIDALYEPEMPGKNICIFWEGTNDISQGKTDTQAYNNIKSYCQARKAIGWKVIIGTLPPRTYLGAANQEAYRLSVNTIILENALSEGWADAIADIASDEVMGNIDTTYDRDYYYDRLHMTPAGHNLVMPYFRDALLEVL